MKYFANINFIHNSISIKSGEVFEDNIFTKEDIDFLKSTRRIGIEPKTEPVFDVKKEKTVKEKVEKVVEQLIPEEVKEEIKEEIKEDIENMKRPQLLKLASSLGIKGAYKLSNSEVVEKIKQKRDE